MTNVASQPEDSAGVWGLAQDHLDELLEIFREDAPAQLATLREATSQGDCATARRVAHLLRGEALALHLGELAHICTEMETAARAGQAATLQSWLPPLAAELARLGVVSESI